MISNFRIIVMKASLEKNKEESIVKTERMETLEKSERVDRLESPERLEKPERAKISGAGRRRYRKTLIYALLLLGFLAMEFPGILIVKDRIYPLIFGMPFLYGYMLCCWVYMCAVLFYAYRTSWGKNTFFKRNAILKK